jgi:hypothetical protein
MGAEGAGGQVLHVKLDEPLRQIFSEDRLPLRRVSERLSEMATQEQPIQVDYRLKLRGAVKPVVYEALVQVQDPIMLHMRELVQVVERGCGGSATCGACHGSARAAALVGLEAMAAAHRSIGRWARCLRLPRDRR